MNTCQEEKPKRKTDAEIRERLQRTEKILEEEEELYAADPLSINLHEVEAETECKMLRWVLGE